MFGFLAVNDYVTLGLLLLFLVKFSRFLYTYVIRSVKHLLKRGSRRLYSSIRFNLKYYLVKSLQKFACSFYYLSFLALISA